MTAPGESALRDVAILTRATERVFRKLIRMLIGKMSLKKLQEMIQIIFVEEAEATLKAEAPGKNVALGDIALHTGVDTRTIKKIRDLHRHQRSHSPGRCVSGRVHAVVQGV